MLVDRGGPRLELNELPNFAVSDACSTQANKHENARNRYGHLQPKCTEAQNHRCSRNQTCNLWGIGSTFRNRSPAAPHLETDLEGIRAGMAGTCAAKNEAFRHRPKSAVIAIEFLSVDEQWSPLRSSFPEEASLVRLLHEYATNGVVAFRVVAVGDAPLIINLAVPHRTLLRTLRQVTRNNEQDIRNQRSFSSWFSYKTSHGTSWLANVGKSIDFQFDDKTTQPKPCRKGDPKGVHSAETLFHS